MSLKRIYTVTGLVISVIILAIVAFTTWYTVDESDQAVIMTFGKAEQTVSEPGLHFKLPWPIQEVDRKSTRLNSSHVKISYAVFCLIHRSPRSPLFPYTTLFRSLKTNLYGNRSCYFSYHSSNCCLYNLVYCR